MVDVVERAERLLNAQKEKALYIAEHGTHRKLAITAQEWLTLLRAFRELKERGMQ